MIVSIADYLKSWFELTLTDFILIHRIKYGAQNWINTAGIAAVGQIRSPIESLQRSVSRSSNRNPK